MVAGQGDGVLASLTPQAAVSASAGSCTSAAGCQRSTAGPELLGRPRWEIEDVGDGSYRTRH